MPFGGWLNCEHCGLRGDPIRVYEQVYRIKTFDKLRSTLEEEFKSEGSFDEDWEAYRSFHTSYYGKVEKFWHTAQRNASNYGQNFHARRLYDLDMWRDQNTFNKCMKDKVGMVHRGQLEDILGELPSGVRRQPYIRMLVMPLCWVPGFITGFALVGSKDEVKYMSVLPDYFGGFFNLGNSSTRVKKTLVVDSPIQVLRMVLKAYLEKVDMPAIVSPLSTSLVDWSTLYGKVVYWHDDAPPEGIKKYLTSAHCLINTSDSLPEWPSERQRMERWASALCPKVIKAATSPQKQKCLFKFCINAILDKSTNSLEYLDRLNPTIQTKYILLEKCLNHQKRKLTALFEDIDFQDTVQLKGSLIYERDGKWWIRNKKRQREDADEILSEVLLVIGTVYRNADLTSSSYSGYLLYKGMRIDFVVGAKELQKNPRDYIELVCAHAGIETLPYISDWGRLNILKIAELFKPPDVVKVRDVVGFDDLTGKFYLPQIIISATRIEVGGQYVYPGPALPGAGIGKQLEAAHSNDSGLNTELLEGWMEPYYECLGYWAVVAAMMNALQAKIEGRTNTGIVLVGDKGSLAEHLFNIIRYDFDLLKSDLNSFVARERALEAGVHGLPLAIDGLRCKKVDLRNWIDKTSSPNTLLLADPLYASSMGPDPDWTFIRAEATPLNSDLVLAGTEMAVPSILQYTLVTQPHDLCSAFDNCVEIANTVGKDGALIDKARRITSTSGYINSKSELACFLGLIDEMSEQGILGTRKELVVCLDADEITIDINLIQKAAKRARLYVRRWDVRNQLKTFGFSPIEDEVEVKYRGSFKVWQRLMKAVRRLKHTQRFRGNSYANSELK